VKGDAMTEKGESESAKEWKPSKKDINLALNVDGGDFPLPFDNDIFLLDYWDSESGLHYLIGLSSSSMDEVIVNREQWNEDLVSYDVVITLQKESYSSEYDPDITKAFSRKLNRFRRIWESGNHPTRNPPSYYIEWALSKGLVVPWLDHAIKKGFYKPNHKAESSSQRKDRLSARRNELRSQGIKAFNQITADEEGISVQRLKQILDS
jgi:hypothetical protein